MSFADVLKETQKNAIEEEKNRPQAEFQKIIYEWLENIEHSCVAIAKSGGNVYRVNLQKHISQIDQSKTCIKTETIKANDGDESNKYHLQSCERDWSYARPFFYHFRFEQNQTNGRGSLRSYPCFFGLTEVNADWVVAALKGKFESEGLKINVRAYPINNLLRVKQVYVKYNPLEQILFGAEGVYKEETEKDSELYDILGDIEW